jgi:DNA modification methylase
VPAGIRLLNRDFLTDVANIPDGSIDLILCDPPYGLGKDYGNDSDMRSGEDFLAWTRGWLELAIPKLKPSGSLYIFCTWQYAPEIFSFLKTKLTMINEIIWDRRVPSMGGTVRRFTSVHDNIGFFAVSKDYFSISIPSASRTMPSRRRRVRVNCSKAVSGWSLAIIRRTSGRYRGCIGNTPSASIIRPRSLWKSSSGWCWQVVPRAGACSTRLWAAAPPQSLAPGSSANSSAMRSMKVTAQ